MMVFGIPARLHKVRHHKHVVKTYPLSNYRETVYARTNTQTNRETYRETKRSGTITQVMYR